MLATITNFQSIKSDGVYGDPVGAGLSGRRIAAMVVNDNAFGLVKRGALEFFASKLAPTGIALAVFCAIARRAIFYAGEKPACYPNR